MSVEYCEHDYPLNGNCPYCELAEARRENAALRAALQRLVSMLAAEDGAISVSLRPIYNDARAALAEKHAP